MAQRFESRIGKLEYPGEKIFHFITDFRNFKEMVLADKVDDFQATADECTFSINMLGQLTLTIIEKEPCKLVKIKGHDQSGEQSMFLWAQLKQVAETDTRAKLTMELDLPPMMKMMAGPYIKDFLDDMMDRLEGLKF